MFENGTVEEEEDGGEEPNELAQKEEAVAGALEGAVEGSVKGALQQRGARRWRGSGRFGLRGRAIGHGAGKLRGGKANRKERSGRGAGGGMPVGE